MSTENAGGGTLFVRCSVDWTSDRMQVINRMAGGTPVVRFQALEEAQQRSAQEVCKKESHCG